MKRLLITSIKLEPSIVVHETTFPPLYINVFEPCIRCDIADSSFVYFRWFQQIDLVMLKLVAFKVKL